MTVSVTSTSTERYARSYQEFDLAKTIIPGGVTKARVPHVPGRYPVYMQRAKGSRVWDIDGNEYIDWMSGYGCILLGHAHEKVDQAAIRQMQQGFTSFLSNPLQNRLAERLIEIIPSAQMVRFFKTGTDATTAAVRIARIHTGRDKVVRWGFHGWADWGVSNFHGFDAGVPQCVRDLTLAFEYNDIDSLKEVFRQHGDDIAAVIMMPLEMDEPADGFLEAVKSVCHEHGSVLIFDEIRSGFRMSIGGAQEYYGVTPDLTTISKGMANGYPISAVVGSRQVMQAVEKGLFSATFFVSSMEMAASMASLDIMQQEDVIGHLWRTGKKLQEGFRKVIADTGLPADVVGLPPMPFVKFTVSDEQVNTRVKEEFYAAAAAGGVYLHPGHHWFVNYAHTEEDVEKTLEVCAAAATHAKSYL